MGTGDDHVCGLVTNLAGGKNSITLRALLATHTHTRVRVYIITTVWRSSSSEYYLRVWAPAVVGTQCPAVAEPATLTLGPTTPPGCVVDVWPTYGGRAACRTAKR